MSPIRINGRDYEVAKREGSHPLDRGTIYSLTGKRGARYATCRNVNHPEQMFLVHDGRGFGIPHGFEGVWLTDKNGTLEVLR